MSPWTSKTRKYHGLRATERIKAILDCVAIEVLGGPTKVAVMKDHEICKGLENTLVDVSQNPIRRAFTNQKGEAKCLHTNTVLYSFHRDGVVLPFEQMLLLGHSRSLQIPACMKDKDLQSLSGMGICLPCIGLVLTSMMVTTGL